MGAFIDLTGYKQPEPGRLTVIKKLYKKDKEWVWECECSCPAHNHVKVEGRNIRGLKVKSCGCLKKESDRKPKGNVKDMTGLKFGHLTVIERAGSDSNGQAKWLCECDCEMHTKLIVLGNNLRKGHTMSCGCDRRSHGEIKIFQLLRDNDIQFEQEYKAFKFSNGNWARFDFYINNQYLIEYDGESHYNYNLHGWHNQEQVKAQQERDIIKNQWCKNNNIPLIRIPYWRLKDLCIEDLQLETTNYLVN